MKKIAINQLKLIKGGVFNYNQANSKEVNCALIFNLLKQCRIK